MTDKELGRKITDEMVETLARVIYSERPYDPPWDKVPAQYRVPWLNKARGVLTAASPPSPTATRQGLSGRGRW